MITNRQKLVALLPMKANSERVPNKNFKDIAGKPLFRWILDALLLCEEIERIVINTDAISILEKNNLKHGDADGKIIIRDRKKDLIGDLVSMNLIIDDDIKAIPSDTYFMTHTTNPLLSPETIKRLYKEYLVAYNAGYDSLFTVNKIQTRFYTPDGEPINHDPDKLLRTQDLPVFCEENSLGYFFSQSSFAKTGSRIGRNPVLSPTPPLESVDIDEQSDWVIAEALLARLQT